MDTRRSTPRRHRPSVRVDRCAVVLAGALAASCATAAAWADDSPPCAAFAGPGTGFTLRQEGTDVALRLRIVTGHVDRWSVTVRRTAGVGAAVEILTDHPLGADAAGGELVGCTVSCENAGACWGIPASPCVDCDGDGTRECARACVAVPYHDDVLRDRCAPVGHVTYEVEGTADGTPGWTEAHAIDVVAVGRCQPVTGSAGAGGAAGASVTGGSQGTASAGGAAGASATGGAHATASAGGAAPLGAVEVPAPTERTSACDILCAGPHTSPRTTATAALASLGIVAAWLARRRAA